MVYVLGSCAFIVGDLLAWDRHSFYEITLFQGGAEFADLGRTLTTDHNAKEIIMLVSKTRLWKLFALVLLLVIFTTKFVSCWFFTFVMTLCRVGLKSPMLEWEDSLQTTRITLSWMTNAWRELNVLGVSKSLHSKHQRIQWYGHNIT